MLKLEKEILIEYLNHIKNKNNDKKYQDEIEKSIKNLDECSTILQRPATKSEFMITGYRKLKGGQFKQYEVLLKDISQTFDEFKLQKERTRKLKSIL